MCHDPAHPCCGGASEQGSFEPKIRCAPGSAGRRGAGPKLVCSSALQPDYTGPRLRISPSPEAFREKSWFGSSSWTTCAWTSRGDLARSGASVPRTDEPGVEGAASRKLIGDKGSTTSPHHPGRRAQEHIRTSVNDRVMKEQLVMYRMTDPGWSVAAALQLCDRVRPRHQGHAATIRTRSGRRSA